MIARDLGALPEVIQDSGGGFVYRTDEDLLDAMNRIASFPSLREELGERGYAAFLQNWSRDAHMHIYFDFLEKNARAKYGWVPWRTEAAVGRELEIHCNRPIPR